MEIKELMEIMAMLRDPVHGCPWDRKQTFQSIAPHTLEEVYEVIDTIENEDHQHLANELGDLLFQVVFYAQLGKEQGYFDFNDVVAEIGNKLLTRHPHVFPEATVESFGIDKVLSSEQVEGNWEKIKQFEREANKEKQSVLNDIPVSFPALLRAKKIQKRVASIGFDWPDHSGVLDKVREEIDELEEAIAENSQAHIEEEFGDLLFSLVNLSRHLKIDSETSLRKANRKFEHRFKALETKVDSDNTDIQSLSLESLEEYWLAVKNEQNK